MGNIRIKGIECLFPPRIVENRFFLEHFEKQGKHIENLLEAYGRKERHMLDDGETILTMSVEVGKKVLKNCGLTGEDIDLLIFTTQTPEYIWPTNALVVFSELGINRKAQLYDENSSCLGMMNAVSTANFTLKGNPSMKRALVIGAEQFSIATNKENEYLYPLFGDSACAVILEKTDDTENGIIDTNFLSDREDTLEYVLYPKTGFSNVVRKGDKFESYWKPFDAGFVPDVAYELNNELLTRNSMTLSDVNIFCYSQYALAMTKGIAQRYNVDLNKFIYVGDKYGYTGTNSPFVALNDAIKSGKVKRGDIVNLWSVGIFWTTCGILMRY